MKNHKLLTVLLSALLLTAATACTPTVHARGNMLQDHQLSEIMAGTDTRFDVLRKLGSPTTEATFDENIWYYIGQTTEKRGILDDDVVEERIVAVVFNEDGTVNNVQDIDTNRNDIPYVRRKTETTGNDVTALQQMLGNLGRFNSQGAGKAAGVGNPVP